MMASARDSRLIPTGGDLHQHRRAACAPLQLDDRSLLVEWKLAYRRGYMMHASVAIVGGFFGAVAFFSSFEWRWLLGAVVLLSNWAYTIVVIIPTNHRLMPHEHTGGCRHG